MLIDTHCHLTHDRFDDDRDAVIDRCREAGLLRAVTIGTGIADGRAARELTRRHSDLLLCTVGLDPFSSHEAGDAFADHLAELDTMLGEGGWVGLGEIGLDYHYEHLAGPAVQIPRFEQQLDLARRHDLPVVIHVRDAHEDMLRVLTDHPDNRGIIHSFTGDPAILDRYLTLDRWLISFNGISTFKSTQDTVLMAAARCPADRLLIETDSPYLAPVPKRGKRCEPQWVAHVADCIAEARGERSEDVRAWTTRNACRVFGIEGVWPERLAGL